jgi:hypothetical protein
MVAGRNPRHSTRYEILTPQHCARRYNAALALSGANT